MRPDWCVLKSIGPVPPSECCSRRVITHQQHLVSIWGGGFLPLTVTTTFRLVLSLRVTLDSWDVTGQMDRRYKRVFSRSFHHPQKSAVDTFVRCSSGYTGTKPVDLCVLLLSQGSQGQDGLPGSDGEPGEDVSSLALRSPPRQ